jgi:phospholipid/cholesterol/gamma-HCH transport system substrate-binding protein
MALASLRAARLGSWLRAGLAVIVLAGAAVLALNLSSSAATYPLTVDLSKAPGLFPGASVHVEGVAVGTVTSVENVANKVVVGMQIKGTQPIPRDVIASLVAPQLLGEPDIELDPGYTGGPRLAAGSTIPESRTTIPVSTDQLLKSLQRTLDALDPHAVGNLVSNLAQDLNGQGQGLNQLIAGAAGTLKLLADKGNSLGQLNGTLAQLTGVLGSQTAQITQLITSYDTVSGVVAQHSTQLNDALAQLSGASSQLVRLLVPNLVPLEADIGTVATAGRTLDRNLGSVDGIFSSATLLFTAAQRAYDPAYNWLNLNSQIPPGVTGAYVAGLVRDRLAGICRRVQANHATGLSAAALATLASCGDPNSGFFDPILSLIPTVLNSLAGGSGAPGLGAPATPATAFQKGLAEIPGLPGAAPGTPAPAAPSTAPGPTTTTPPTCGLLTLLGCPLGLGSTGPNTSGGANSGLGGLLGGLLSAPSTGGAPKAAIQTVSQTSPATPSLDLAAENLLPPMPSSVAGATHRPSKSTSAAVVQRWVQAHWAGSMWSFP